jgi:hypothetical protein
MHGVLGDGTILGYCTNVHPGESLEQIQTNLERHALPVKRRVSSDQAMGVGLWFSASVAEQLNEDGVAEQFRDWLEARRLLPYTLNGFPYGNFHQERVKRDVYLPDWSDPRRLLFTQKLASVLHRLLPEGAEGSISTLPLGWNESVGEGWAGQLSEMVEFLATLEERTGRLIHINIEPEPGCEIGDTPTFFMLMAVLERLSDLPAEMLRRYLRVCHDICHAAVMFEPPSEVLEWCRETGYRVGKVQISSGLRADFAARPEAADEMRQHLQRFVEPRYLHQTTIGTPRPDREGVRAFYADLPEALNENTRGEYEWRVHFHVPVYLDSLGPLGTTQQHIHEFLRAIRPEDGIRHFEVETYAWDVLPQHLKVPELADGIAREMMWVIDEAKAMQ